MSLNHEQFGAHVRGVWGRDRARLISASTPHWPTCDCGGASSGRRERRVRTLDRATRSPPCIARGLWDEGRTPRTGCGCRRRGTRSRSSESWEGRKRRHHAQSRSRNTTKKKNTSSATGARAALPFERDAETGSGGLGKVEDAGAVDGDEHLQAESQLHLPQPTGDDQRHEAGGSRHGRVVARAQGV